jgi:hypothetical protein
MPTLRDTGQRGFVWADSMASEPVLSAPTWVQHSPPFSITTANVWISVPIVATYDPNGWFRSTGTGVLQVTNTGVYAMRGFMAIQVNANTNGLFWSGVQLPGGATAITPQSYTSNTQNPSYWVIHYGWTMNLNGGQQTWPLIQSNVANISTTYSGNWWFWRVQ